MRNKKINRSGFTLIEVLVGTAIFLIFAVGIYSTIDLVFKVVYQSRVRILETALLSEQLEVARNLPYESVGILNGVPAGVLLSSKILTRNGIDFFVTTTVRNIDDAFDGTLGGSPNDTSPADYKLVEMSAICANCLQKTPVILSTMVAPKSLEGASKNGALFVYVYDMNGLPVQGANVHVVNSATNPDTVLDDVTDAAGMLRVVDAPTGTISYSINVGKSGYSSDYTVASSAQIPNPLKQPANVVSQMVTEIYFSIDRVGTVALHTLNPSCAAIAGVPLSLHGEKRLAADPDVYKFSSNFTTNGNGEYNFSNLEWDKYHLALNSTAYDMAGSAPMLPLDLTPGLNQELSVVLRAHTTNSLLVKVRDAGAKLPLSNVSVRLTATGYDQTLITSLGYTRQTDWSGGSGQVEYTNESKYFSDNGNLTINYPAGDLKLKKVGNFYLNNGILESSTFDFGTAVSLRNIIWEPLSQYYKVGSDSIKFQIAASNSSTLVGWDFLGPDGTANTYYISTTTLIYQAAPARYIRYKVFLNTVDTKYTPTLSEAAFTYTSSCTPPGQVFFNGLSAGAYNLEITRGGYAVNVGALEISGNTETEVNLSPIE